MMTDLERIFRQCFVDGAGEIYNCISTHKTSIKNAMNLYAQCEVEKSNSLPTDDEIMIWSLEWCEGDAKAQASFRVMAKFMRECMKQKINN